MKSPEQNTAAGKLPTILKRRAGGFEFTPRQEEQMNNIGEWLEKTKNKLKEKPTKRTPEVTIRKAKEFHLTLEQEKQMKAIGQWLVRIGNSTSEMFKTEIKSKNGSRVTQAEFRAFLSYILLLAGFTALVNKPFERVSIPTTMGNSLSVESAQKMINAIKMMYGENIISDGTIKLAFTQLNMLRTLHEVTGVGMMISSIIEFINIFFNKNSDDPVIISEFGDKIGKLLAEMGQNVIAESSAR